MNYGNHECYILAAVLRPGDEAWIQGKTSHLLVYTVHRLRGKLRRRVLRRLDLARGPLSGGHREAARERRRRQRRPPFRQNPVTRSDSGPEIRFRQSIYTFESRDELLAACVVVVARNLAAAISVSIYALDSEDVDGSDQQRWLKRDGRSLVNDRILFLGCPTSFAVDAARFPDEVAAGGCAYFVLNSRKAGWTWRKVPEARRVYRYSFEDGSATEVEELPLDTGWKSAVMWMTPRPSVIAPGQISALPTAF